VIEFAYRNFGALLGDYTGPLARWMGPFGNVNYAGPIGAFLLVYGLLRHGKRRVLFIAAGALIVVGSDSRTSILSCAAGVAALIALAPQLGTFRTPVWLRIASPVAVAVAFVGYVTVIDPTLNQRTPVWEVFLSTWKASPVTGVGSSGLQAVIDGGSLQSWANHGHNILIDPLARFGMVGVMAVMAVIIASGVIATQAARTGLAASAVLFVTCLADGFSEDLVDWRYLGVQAVPLMLAGLLGAAWLTQVRREEDS
jgi:O-antigen ligase